MMGKTLITLSALAALPLAFASPTARADSCDVLTARQVRSMGNNTLFTRWRPYSHVNAPAGWMNDPCGPMYDPVRDIYHVFYQWHPQHINWGNISWGYATSKDLITFTDHNSWQGNDALALGPTGNGTFPQHYNGLGIFSGTAQPVNLQGQVDGTLLLFYTSVAKLPTSWTLPYMPHTESQSMAYSTDGGQTWLEVEGNPLIRATTETAPMYWNITGFRDPFFEPSPALDAVLGVSEPHYYAVFGSGIKGVGPRIPLWTAPASDLTSWSFLGALWEPADNSTLGTPLTTHTYGFNFEVSGFFDLLDSAGNTHWYVNMGAEGGNLTFAESMHSALWNEGTVTRRANGSAEFTPIAGGLGDWGLSYALTSFNDTKNNRRVQLAWSPEDIVGDSGLFSTSQQGFQGSLALFRELFVHEVDNVVDTNGAIAASKSAVLTPNNDGTYLAQTLGVKPLPDVVEGLRQGSTSCPYGSGTYTSQKILKAAGSSSMELTATVKKASGAVGLVIAAAPDMSEYTQIIYEPSNSTLLVVREHSTRMKKQFNTATVTGYFAPYTTKYWGGYEEQEAITMDVFLDGSLLEVYVNDRFALATRIYPASTCSTGYGVYVEDGTSAEFENVQAWENLYHVWSDRPLDSSSPLVYDTAAETNNYVWWSGN